MDFYIHLASNMSNTWWNYINGTSHFCKSVLDGIPDHTAIVNYGNNVYYNYDKKGFLHIIYNNIKIKIANKCGRCWLDTIHNKMYYRINNGTNLSIYEFIPGKDHKFYMNCSRNCTIDYVVEFFRKTGILIARRWFNGATSEGSSTDYTILKIFNETLVALTYKRFDRWIDISFMNDSGIFIKTRSIHFSTGTSEIRCHSYRGTLFIYNNGSTVLNIVTKYFANAIMIQESYFRIYFPMDNMIDEPLNLDRFKIPWYDVDLIQGLINMMGIS